MRNNRLNIILNFVTVLAVTLFFSCQSKEKKTKKNLISEDAPIAEGFEINLKYTDSGRLTAILKAPRILDFTNSDFGYWEFPDGIVLDMIDKDGGVSVVTSDYAVSYEKTGLIDMRGNVDIKTADSTHLQAQQLYWDQNINWVFTDLPYKSRLPDGATNEADGFDANQDFTILNSRINEGVMFIEE
ncbi:LPS export ABC transporter periplasmic protein LptC [Aquimarina sp. MMG016]|uniref:LPS export ABC transporter periplasmic protein LptC n=1 Tax=Aquimarina sp. MMG016 TaxID=2822690 RepID=UPI001B3A7B83|nr:LPS export ABC transporter periplasmic protein LptC [Aquimarina sp. MMG016]MBQ4820809.1 LPS export ABC transporter periplasmic protein LptC [Aquimarina sp. MMG016]